MTAARSQLGIIGLMEGWGLGPAAQTSRSLKAAE